MPAATQQLPPQESMLAHQPGSVRDSTDRTRVLADQVELLYQQSPLGIAVTLVVAALVAYELTTTEDLVYAWGTLIVVVAVSRLLLLRAYRKAAERDSAPELWLRRFAIGALATGANWGLAGAVFFPQHTDIQQVFLAFVLAGMSAGGLPIFSAVWWVYVLYAAGVILPFAIVLLAYGTALFTELALLIPLFFALNVAIAYRLNEVFVSGYRLRVSYRRLTEDYTGLNQRLEQRLAELGEARRQVEASGRKLALFSGRSPIPVIEVDAEGTIMTMNPAGERVFGYAASELIGKPGLWLLLSAKQGDEATTWWKQFAARAVPEANIRQTYARSDGVEIVCEWTLTPLVNEQGTLISVIAQGHDITQQLEAERLKQEFTSTLSHELRTPLTSIIGSLQIVNSGVFGDLDKDVGELTEVAERNGHRLLDLINDILDMEKLESGKLSLSIEPLSLDELLRESIKLNEGFATRFKVTLSAGEPLPSIRVSGDRKRLQQVMTNLLSNAAKFSPVGGVVDVALREKDGGDVVVTVSDRGPGIPENFHNRIFGRFAQADSTVTRAKGGTGLGLSICKRLIEVMDGSIGFADREGGGTTFWFELPKLDNAS